MVKIFDADSKDLPDWYWINGLHDAKIISCNSILLDYDYRTKNPIRNYLELKLDSKQALMDNTVKLIKFFNFSCDNFECLNNAWWISDSLSFDNGKYILELIFDKLKDGYEKVVIKFDYAEVERREILF